MRSLKFEAEFYAVTSAAAQAANDHDGQHDIDDGDDRDHRALENSAARTTTAAAHSQLLTATA